ncbi:MAG: 4-(cytidine 5'-diphospho)-2-C-methyl-D-erythritol kinase [Bacteroidales bacterium]|nr:4-(cytidine 5'-diphospho)-2-C-methyl-D-erythritol kinase [Bacteroidales bacterium]
MILFPNAKINLGLRILRRRPDGYHDLLTVMMPIAWTDILEIVPSSTGKTSLHITGRAVECPTDKNLVMKAYHALANEIGGLPPAEIHLEKIIPDGAGMGGGSADAAFAIRGLNEVFNLGLDEDRMAHVAATVGADCPFFIYNRPMFCTGTGTTMSADVHIDFTGYTIVIAKPRVSAVSTAAAYAGVTPCEAVDTPLDLLGRDIRDWAGLLINDFEASIFPRLPQVAAVKQTLIDCGAIYASMTGSGAAVYGIFATDKLAREALTHLTDCDTFVDTGRAW